MKKTYVTPTQEVILRDAQHIFTMTSGGEGGWDNMHEENFEDLIVNP